MRSPAACLSACFALGGAALPRRQKWADLHELLLGMDHKLFFGSHDSSEEELNPPDDL